MDYINIVVIGLLLAYIYIQGKEHKEERQDLVDRLMSKDYNEYRRARVEPSREEDEEMLSYWDN